MPELQPAASRGNDQDLTQALREFQQFIVRFERRMAAGHVVMIALLVLMTVGVAAMTYGIWRLAQ